MTGRTFPGIYVDGRLCATAAEAARRAGVSAPTIYRQLNGDWSKPAVYAPHGPTHRNIVYRGRVYADIPAAVKAEGVSKQAVHKHLKRSGQIEVRRAGGEAG